MKKRMAKEIDIGILIELMSEHTDGWVKTVDDKLYNLITNSQLIEIIKGYINKIQADNPREL